MELRNKRIIVTGGAGFIGSHLVDRLLELDNHVTVIDNLSDGRKQHINHEAELVNGDLRDKDFCITNIKNADIVFHLAANSNIHLGAEHTNLDFEMNIIGTDNVLEAIRINHIKNICFSSSFTVYGNVKTVPVAENYGPLVPISLYGASKLADEALISGYCGTFGMQATIVRFANIIGPRQKIGIIHDFVDKLSHNPNQLEVLGDGSNTKSYIYITDCIDAIVKAVENSKDSVNLFNISYEDTLSAAEIAKLAVKQLSPKAKITFTGKETYKGDVKVVLMDSSKLKSIGWKPKFNSKTAVLETIKEFENQFN
jgi:UDP-glucose 4-epimerase